MGRVDCGGDNNWDNCDALEIANTLAMKHSIIFVTALSLVAMTLASCSSAFAPDDTQTTGVTRQTNEPPPERSAGDSISGGHY